LLKYGDSYSVFKNGTPQYQILKDAVEANLKEFNLDEYFEEIIE